MLQDLLHFITLVLLFFSSSFLNFQRAYYGPTQLDQEMQELKKFFLEQS